MTNPAVAGSVLWPLADHLGTIRDLANSSGSIVNHRRYDSFGNLISETNADIDELFSYTGRLFDETTGLQYNLNRWYDPKTGRWTTDDPIGFAAGDTNLSRYVGNDPTEYADPSGLAPPDSGVIGRGPGSKPIHGINYGDPVQIAMRRWLSDYYKDDEYDFKLATLWGDISDEEDIWKATDAAIVARMRLTRTTMCIRRADQIVAAIDAILILASGKAAYSQANARAPIRLPPPLKGGPYEKVRAGNIGGQVHHTPAASISPYTRVKGPTVWMATADHTRTASWGNSRAAQAFRQQQADLIAQGRLRDAIQMDINDIRSKFGTKYDEHIAQMLNAFGFSE